MKKHEGIPFAVSEYNGWASEHQADRDSHVVHALMRSDSDLGHDRTRHPSSSIWMCTVVMRAYIFAPWTYSLIMIWFASAHPLTLTVIPITHSNGFKWNRIAFARAHVNAKLIGKIELQSVVGSFKGISGRRVCGCNQQLWCGWINICYVDIVLKICLA